jgi:hypothetical protein
VSDHDLYGRSLSVSGRVGSAARLDRDWSGRRQSPFIRVLDIGGMIWEGAEEYPTLDNALQAADQAVTTWMRQQFGESQSATPPRASDHATWRSK